MEWETSESNYLEYNLEYLSLSNVHLNGEFKMQVLDSDATIFSNLIMIQSMKYVYVKSALPAGDLIPKTLKYSQFIVKFNSLGYIID